MPAPVEISVDEYLSKRSLSSHDGMVYRAAKMPKSFNAELRSATLIMTDETVDSYGDIVKAKGADLERFKSNPIALLNHKSDRIIGTWGDIVTKPKSIEGTVTVALEGTSPHVDEAYALMSQGILRAASIGFMPKKVERRLDDNGEPLWSYIIHEWDLYECSIVSIPANPSALAKSVADGNTMARDLLEEMLDTYVKTAAGVIISRADFEAAHKEATGNKTTVTVEAPEWLGEVRSLVDRMEKLAPTSFTITGDLTDEALEKIKTAMASHRGVLEPGTPAAIPDPVVQELELNVEGFLKDFAPKIDAIPEEEGERRGTLSKLLDGIRAVFKSPDVEPEQTPEDPPAPVAADPEKQKALNERLAAIEARHQDAA
jgi:HK97 family phage prohead protease